MTVSEMQRKEEPEGSFHFSSLTPNLKKKYFYEQLRKILQKKGENTKQMQ